MYSSFCQKTTKNPPREVMSQIKQIAKKLSKTSGFAMAACNFMHIELILLIIDNSALLLLGEI
jgi:hypothetical protein